VDDGVWEEWSMGDVEVETYSQDNAYIHITHSYGEYIKKAPYMTETAQSKSITRKTITHRPSVKSYAKRTRPRPCNEHRTVK
jgi:hypothetical protein